MAEHSLFFNSEFGDRVYTASDFANYFSTFIRNGVMLGGAFLRISRTIGLGVRLSQGKAFINGYLYDNRDAAKDMTLQSAHPSLPRIDRIVLRLDLRQEGRAITAAVKTGVAASAPIAPVLQRDNEIWEIGIADIRVNAGVSELLSSNITDIRADTNICGIITRIID